MICDLMTKEDDSTEKDAREREAIYPLSFIKLERFFKDLKEDFGNFDIFEEVGLIIHSTTLL